MSIDAGSTTLHGPSGRLLATEIEKHIAIPGAVDMVATIAALVDRKEVSNSTISADSDELTIVLEPPAAGEPTESRFVERVHAGFRVWVEGAGPSGADLVTTIEKVEDDGLKLVLATPAATSVTGVRTIANDPKRILLSDHARATVGSLDVDLGDRQVSDAEMIVGDRALRSDTVAFSFDDLGKTVTIRGAGHLATTIVEVIDDETVELAHPAQRAVTDGPADIWQTDSAPGLRDLLNAVRGSDGEAAEIIFGPGIYDFTRISKNPNDLPAAIGLEDLTNVTVRGAGPATILRLMPEQDLINPQNGAVLDTDILMARNCRKLTIRDLTLHGAYLTMRQAVEQMHGLHLSQGCGDVVVEQIEVFQSAGDGVRLLGEPDNKLSRAWIRGCRLIQNKRSGIAVQRAVNTIWIRDCYIEMTPPSSDACIDFEPTGQLTTEGPTDIVIDSNVLVHATPSGAVSLSGTGAGQPARRVRFTNNIVRGGGVGGVNSVDLTIAGNTILAGTSRPALAFQGTLDGLRIENNRIVAEGALREGITVTRRPPDGPSRVRIAANDVQASGVGIRIVTDRDHVEIRDNRVVGTGASIGIRVEAVGPSAPRDIRIVDNTVTNFGVAGILLASRDSARLAGVQVTGNDLHVDSPSDPNLIGISLAGTDTGPPWMDRAVVTANRISDSIAIKIDRPADTVPFVVTSGNPEDPANYEGVIAPETNPGGGAALQTNVPAALGSVYARIDREGPPAFYLRTIHNGEERWVEVAKIET